MIKNLGATMQQIRIDRSTIPKVKRTPEGYLRGDAIVTRTGVFEYLNADGSLRLELRHPDDILKEDSLSSLSSLPITIDHPRELVNADNAQSLSVGLTGDRAEVDGQLIKARMTVTHKDGVLAVDGGRKELSLGYTTDLIEESGVYDGKPYTHRQTNVRYNHLALVPKARAGAMARINLDGAAVQNLKPLEEVINMSNESRNVALNLDGITYDAAPEVAKALNELRLKLDASEKENEDVKKTKADMQKELDGYQAKIDELKKQMDELKSANNDEAINEAAKARISLLAKAGKVVNTDEMHDKSAREIMEAVITERNDGIDLTSKSDDYVSARFDAVIESIPAKDAINKQAEQTKRADQAPAERLDALEILKSQWKGDK